MRTAILYKITNIVNLMCYYGIIIKKGKTIEERFEEHMAGNGGIHLYREGVLKYGKNNFKIEMLEVGELQYIINREIELNSTNLYPIGYNGNNSSVIVVHKDTHKIITEKKRAGWASGKYEKPIPPNWKGKKRSESMKKKLSESKKGFRHSDKTKSQIAKAKTGHKQSVETINKRKSSIERCDNPYNRKEWLLISPSGVYYHSIGKIEELTNSLGLSYSRLLIDNLNSGIPIQAKRKSPLIGWIVYNDSDIIKKLIKNNETKIY